MHNTSMAALILRFTSKEIIQLKNKMLKCAIKLAAIESYNLNIIQVSRMNTTYVACREVFEDINFVKQNSERKKSPYYDFMETTCIFENYEKLANIIGGMSIKFIKILILSRLIDFCFTSCEQTFSYNHDETMYTHNNLYKLKGGTVIGQWMVLYRWLFKNMIVYK